ncbi:VQ motif-containing protein 29 [Hibiscus syriacus]|uniref:VQ motif-containing protein 29 n=1 Tax=Hibiscus syriacus TaxID=106335 RepID=A0A6A3A9Y6_HIBSY|nr:VQ motif-containing protein 29-like [Hibiscus syriacus]KAE8699995.1 VQ motif-containing protein 29 [Hibiscus syriacus]
MEAYSSSSSSALARGFKDSRSSQASLHSVRKPMGKPWKKPAVSPLQPIPPKVYKVDPMNFRDLVQKLTSGAAEIVPADSLSQHQTPPSRLQRAAPPPPPLQVAPPQPLHMISGLYHTKPQNQNLR